MNRSVSVKSTDLKLIPEADGARFIKPTDGAREAFKGWAKGKDADGDPLTLTAIVKRETLPPNSDRRRRVNRVVASYRGSDGHEYRKSFESYDDPTVPEHGSHKDLNALKEQWRGHTKARDGIFSSPFMVLAALLAILSHFNKETVGPQDYDLTTYKPKRKIF